MKPGLYPELDEQVYHADPDSLSVTGAKVLLKSPALYRYRQDHPEHKDVFDFGSAAHALVLGVGSEIVVHEYDPAKVKSPKSTNAWKAEQETTRGRGAVLLLPDEFATVQAMADRLSSHRLAMRLLSEGQPEVSAFALDQPTGVMRRARFDWMPPNILVDYKTSITADPRDLAGKYGVIRKWGYDKQAAWYTDVARALGHPAQSFAFIFQAKEPPHSVTVAYVRDDDLDDARFENQQALEMFRDCTAAGLWPDYLPDTAAAVVSLTEQHYDTEFIDLKETAA